MEDHPLIPRRQFLNWMAFGLGCAALAVIPGCSLGVMFGRMLKGDPLVPSEFHQMTRRDLTKGDQKVLVICSAPESVDSEYSTLAYDLIDGVTRRMKLHGVDVVNPDLVATWLDENGGPGNDLAELASEFDCDYIVSIEVQSFSFREPNSPKLLRGQATGYVRAYEVTEIGGNRRVNNVYGAEFNSIYPRHQPVSEQGRSTQIFQKEYMDRFCDMLGEKFYDHGSGTDI